MYDFTSRVLAFIKGIPKGKVVSYGQVAATCGKPHGAREVGWILRSADVTGLPWWRVLNNQGIISIKGNWTATKQLQKELIIKEGIEIGSDFKLDMEKYRWQ